MGVRVVDVRRTLRVNRIQILLNGGLTFTRICSTEHGRALLTHLSRLLIVTNLSCESGLSN